jgi:hypothetical protein
MLTRLNNLSISDCRTDNLDLRLYPHLTVLECRECGLTELDISNNLNLHTLDCSDNQLTELDLSKHGGIHYLTCCGNQLTKLDISSCSALVELVRDTECETGVWGAGWRKLRRQSNGWDVIDAMMYVDPDVELITGN